MNPVVATAIPIYLFLDCLKKKTDIAEFHLFICFLMYFIFVEESAIMVGGLRIFL